MERRLILSLVFLLTALCAGCASEPEEPTGKYHPANSVNDLFQVEQGMPIREVKAQDFFYKHCSLVGSHPHFTHVEYSCNAGPEL